MHIMHIFDLLWRQNVLLCNRMLQPRRLQINVKIHCRFFCAGINLNNWAQLLRETHNKGLRIDLNKPFRNCHRQAGPIDTV